MKLRFVWIGKTKSVPIGELIEDYVERIGRFTRVEITQVPDRGDSKAGRELADKEGEAILSRTRDDPFVVLLDEGGRELDSKQLASLLEGHMMTGTKLVTFVVGGHCGVSRAVRERADLALALTRMTLTHEMARALLAEQVYRALTIIHDLPYQR